MDRLSVQLTAHPTHTNTHRRAHRALDYLYIFLFFCCCIYTRSDQFYIFMVINDYFKNRKKNKLYIRQSLIIVADAIVMIITFVHRRSLSVVEMQEFSRRQESIQFSVDRLVFYAFANVNYFAAHFRWRCSTVDVSQCTDCVDRFIVIQRCQCTP